MIERYSDKILLVCFSPFFTVNPDTSSRMSRFPTWHSCVFSVKRQKPAGQSFDVHSLPSQKDKGKFNSLLITATLRSFLRRSGKLKRNRHAVKVADHRMEGVQTSPSIIHFRNQGLQGADNEKSPLYPLGVSRSIRNTTLERCHEVSESKKLIQF